LHLSMTDEQLLLRNTGCAAKCAQQVSRLTWALAIRHTELQDIPVNFSLSLGLLLDL